MRLKLRYGGQFSVKISYGKKKKRNLFNVLGVGIRSKTDGQKDKLDLHIRSSLFTY